MTAQTGKDWSTEMSVHKCFKAMIAISILFAPYSVHTQDALTQGIPAGKDAYIRYLSPQPKPHIQDPRSHLSPLPQYGNTSVSKAHQQISPLYRDPNAYKASQQISRQENPEALRSSTSFPDYDDPSVYKAWTSFPRYEDPEARKAWTSFPRIEDPNARKAWTAFPRIEDPSARLADQVIFRKESPFNLKGHLPRNKREVDEPLRGPDSFGGGGYHVCPESEE